jgi:hypothetical protein
VSGFGLAGYPAKAVSGASLQKAIPKNQIPLRHNLFLASTGSNPDHMVPSRTTLNPHVAAAWSGSQLLAYSTALQIEMIK